MRHIGITGGAGFIGTNAALYFLRKGDTVTIFDNLSRKGSADNLREIQRQYPNIEVCVDDIRNASAVSAFVKKQDVIIHLAAQVAVTTSVQNPMEDFSINALGTLTLLDEVRKSKRKPYILYSSTNKVYGSLPDIPIRETATRYEFVDRTAVDESVPLDFHSPYGCSKGTADQYMRDFYRIYGIPTVVFRQSCIYGPHQFGVEDQGWVAWFLIAAMLGKKITIYGNGKQVRDLLYVDDLLAAYDAAIEHAHTVAGEIFNMGGGPENTLSVWKEFHPILENITGKSIQAGVGSVRQGDQPIFIADTRKFQEKTGWKPRVGIAEGIALLYAFLCDNGDTLQIAFS